jgi:hypothetical protein
MPIFEWECYLCGDGFLRVMCKVGKRFLPGFGQHLYLWAVCTPIKVKSSGVVDEDGSSAKSSSES